MGFRLFRPNPQIEVAPAGWRPRWRGWFTLDVCDKGGRVLGRQSFRNGVTNGGIEDNESVCFAAGTQKTSWFLGLINDAGFSALSPSDTMASHGGWSELTAYDEANRPQWNPSAPSGRMITNPTSASFNINATVAVRGAFLASSNAKGGTAGVLWATGQLSAIQNLSDDQVLKLTYTLTGTSS